MYFREELVFGRELEGPKRLSGGWLIVILAIAPLLGIAWHYGLIASAALALKDASIAIWDTLTDLVTPIKDLVQGVFVQQQ